MEPNKSGFKICLKIGSMSYTGLVLLNANFLLFFKLGHHQSLLAGDLAQNPRIQLKSQHQTMERKDLRLIWNSTWAVVVKKIPDCSLPSGHPGNHHLRLAQLLQAPHLD